MQMIFTLCVILAYDLFFSNVHVALIVNGKTIHIIQKPHHKIINNKVFVVRTDKSSNQKAKNKTSRDSILSE